MASYHNQSSVGCLVCLMGYHGISWDIMGYHGILWDFMGFRTDCSYTARQDFCRPEHKLALQALAEMVLQQQLLWLFLQLQLLLLRQRLPLQQPYPQQHYQSSCLPWTPSCQTLAQAQLRWPVSAVPP